MHILHNSTYQYVTAHSFSYGLTFTNDQTTSQMFLSDKAKSSKQSRFLLLLHRTGLNHGLLIYPRLVDQDIGLIILWF